MLSYQLAEEKHFTSNFSSTDQESKFAYERQGPLRWEQSQKLFELIQKNPKITAEKLRAEGSSFGIEISIRTAFRFLKRYRDTEGDIFKPNQTHLQVIANILKNVKPGTHLSPQAIKQIAGEHGRILHMTTVYRILSRLLAAGTIIQLEKKRKAVYEWKRGENHHGHLNCVICGGMIEFHQDYLDNLAKNICDRFGHEYRGFQFLLYAHCPKCK